MDYTDELVFKEVSIITSFSLAEDSMNAAPQESASFFPSSGLITLGKRNGNFTKLKQKTHSFVLHAYRLGSLF